MKPFTPTTTASIDARGFRPRPLRELCAKPKIEGTNEQVEGLDQPRQIALPTGKQVFLDARDTSNAAAELGRLPPAGTTLHCIMRGNFAAWDLVEAVIDMAREPDRGVVVDALTVASLSTSKRVTSRIARLMDAGTIREMTLVLSCYMRDLTKDVYRDVTHALAARGARVVSIRNHAKVFLIALSDGRRYVFELSANLRSCRNLEQFTLTESPPLYDFHRNWIHDAAAGGDEK